MQQTSTFQHSEPRRDRTGLALILIGVGLVWILAQIGVFSSENLAVLARIWPLILIALGIDLLFAKQRGVSLLIGVVTLVVVFGLMLIGPSVGLVRSMEVTMDTFSEPLDDVQQAAIHLSNGVGDMTVRMLDDATDLITVDTAHIGDVQFDTTGTTNKQVTLRYEDQSGGTTNFFPLFFDQPESELYAHVGLAPNVPINLTVDGGVGDSTFDLTGLTITEVDINVGVGGMNLILPATDSRYSVSVSGGVGDGDLVIAENAAVSVDINAGVGSMNIDLPDNAPIRIEVNAGLGGANVPSWLQQVSETDSRRVYETSAYADASANERIDLIISGGVGSIHVR